MVWASFNCLRKFQCVGVKIQGCSVTLSHMQRDVFRIEAFNHWTWSLVHQFLSKPQSPVGSFHCQWGNVAMRFIFTVFFHFGQNISVKEVCSLYNIQDMQSENNNNHKETALWIALGKKIRSETGRNPGWKWRNKQSGGLVSVRIWGSYPTMFPFSSSAT